MMDEQTEATMIMFFNIMKDVANSKDNSVIMQLKTQLVDDQGKLKQVRVVFLPEQMTMDFPEPLSTKHIKAEITN